MTPSRTPAHGAHGRLERDPLGTGEDLVQDTVELRVVEARLREVAAETNRITLVQVKTASHGAVAGYGGDIIPSQNTPRTARDCEMTACGCTRRIGTNRARYFARESDKVLIFLFDG